MDDRNMLTATKMKSSHITLQALNKVCRIGEELLYVFIEVKFWKLVYTCTNHSQQTVRNINYMNFKILRLVTISDRETL